MSSELIQGATQVTALKAANSMQLQGATTLQNALQELNIRLMQSVQELQKVSSEVQRQSLQIITPKEIDVQI